MSKISYFLRPNFLSIYIYCHFVIEKQETKYDVHNYNDFIIEIQ